MGPEDITPSWLSDALGLPIRAAVSERVGTGQVGMSVRYTLEYEGDPPDGAPATVVAKLPSPDDVSRATGVAMRNYEREVRFYSEVAATVDIRTPRCHLAEWDEATGDFVLLLEDLAPGEQGDQIEGCSLAEARLAVEELARLHAPRWNDPALDELEWLGRRQPDDAPMLQGLYQMMWGPFAERYERYLTAEQLELGEWFGGRIGPWLELRVPPFTVTHGDYRLDNMLFGTDAGGYPLAVVDWQTPGHQMAAGDLSYFLGAGLLPEERRANERELVAHYHAELLAGGVGHFDLGTLWEQYRAMSFAGVVMAVVASMIVGHTDRGEAMFAAMATRHLTHALDLDARAMVA